jgi:hypothetical protein
MNRLKHFTTIVILLIAAISCKKEDDSDPFKNITAPGNLEVSFDISSDNSGLVKIYPSGTGISSYLIDFGDVPDTVPSEYGYNDEITHIYGEGTFQVEITAVGISGLMTSIIEELTVTFIAPENLVVDIQQDPSNQNIVTVSATADYATIMDVYFGEDVPEIPIQALPGEEVTHTYTAPGDYIITVVARSGGTASTSYSDTVNIPEASDPVALPIDFESFSVNYVFIDFGNAAAEVIDNPDPSGLNTSAKVGQFFKAEGAETWAGSFLTLESPIDFTIKKLFKMKVWSPKSGIVVKLKVENLDNGDISHEIDATTTLANEWEELEFDFSDINTAEEYQKIVFFFDFGNAGDGTYYFFDDVVLVPGSLPPTWPVEDFEGDAPLFTSFGNIAAVEVVPNPDVSGLNTTATVAQLTKSSGSETWAGAFFEVADPLDLDNYKKIKLKTYSPKSGIEVLLKLENDDASVEYEIPVTNASVDAWEDLIFDFAGAPPAEYTRIVIFFDFGNVGDDSVYYFDEIELTN